MTLKVKVAIVTGAGRGLGKAFALALAREGFKIVGTVARHIDQAEATAAEIRELGGEAIPLKADVTSPEEIEAMVREATGRFGRVDILVNNAGITAPDSFLQMTPKRWDLIMSVNLDGTFLCTRAVLPQMIEQGSGMVINVSSILAKEIRYSIPYGVTKAGIERFTLGLAREMRRNAGIAITCLRPYFVKTETVASFLPDVDTSSWETPEMWGKYIALVAAAAPQSITGKILDRAALEQMFGKV